MQALLDLLDAGGLSLATAAARLGLTEGQALAALVSAGRTVRVDGKEALATVRGWGRIRVILRAGGSVAEVMSDLGAALERGAWLNDEDDRVHLHLDTSELTSAFVTAKAGHATGRTVRMVAFVDGRDEVLFKVMVPKERTDLVGPFNLLRGKA
ncbi:MAG: ChuX/HutX family heme-like substrate-binding protein [Myxococcota bacterium]